MVLCGDSGAGKTHLVHVWTIETGGNVVDAKDLPNADIAQLAQGHVAVEDADAIAGNEEAERALFHLHNLVLSNGHEINGTDLVNGLQASLPEGVLITGGLAGDGINFTETLVWHNDAVELGQIVLVGFYGDKLSLGHGCIGGWDAFGPDRAITKSASNVLYELDNVPALTLYKKYLGPHAADLPSSALLFPLVLKIDGKRMTRTILNINEQDGSMIFAGDVPEGAVVQLMRANTSKLIDGAEIAAEHALKNINPCQTNGLALLISCVGRRIVLADYCEEELAVVKDTLGEQWTYTGFYSYGELSPMVDSNSCALHNQTMTITTICEIDE